MRQSFCIETLATETDGFPDLSNWVFPVESFGYVAKLSGGGIVVRTLAAPETDKPFYGIWNAEGFKIAETRRQHDLSPFQPIIHARKKTGLNGLAFDVELKPHSKARTMTGLHDMGAGMLLLSSLYVFSQRPEMSIVAILVAMALIAFPRYRAKASFQKGCDQALSALMTLPFFEGASFSRLSNVQKASS